MSYISLAQAEQQKLTIITAAVKKQITNGEAAKKLGRSIRQVQRLKVQVKQHGALAVIHKLKGRLSNHHINQQVKQQLLDEIKIRYTDFKPKFATEKLQEDLQVSITSQTIRVWMTQEGLWKPHKQKKPKYHAWRERKEYFGELEQFDGSYHLWFENRLLDENQDPVEVCLLASIDDATGRITQAKFAFNEGVIPVFNFWKEYVKTLGKPLGIYLDKFSTYKISHPMAVDNFELMTQFQKAMKILDIKLISAHSPQAKGRVERLFRTLQDRLVKELRLANTNSVVAGNLFLKEFIPNFNKRFSIPPAREGDVHKKLTQKEKKDLQSIFSLKSQRMVNSDFTIQFKNHFYQLEEVQPTTIRPKETVVVEEWFNGTVHFKFKDYPLKYFLLPKKPKKVSKNQPAILTSHKLNWKPGPDHPWRLFPLSVSKG